MSGLGSGIAPGVDDPIWGPRQTYVLVVDAESSAKILFIPDITTIHKRKPTTLDEYHRSPDSSRIPPHPLSARSPFTPLSSSTFSSPSGQTSSSPPSSPSVCHPSIHLVREFKPHTNTITTPTSDNRHITSTATAAVTSTTTIPRLQCFVTASDNGAVRYSCSFTSPILHTLPVHPPFAPRTTLYLLPCNFCSLFIFLCLYLPHLAIPSPYLYTDTRLDTWWFTRLSARYLTHIPNPFYPQSPC